MLNPEATNRMTCATCGWTRIVDPSRAYRSGHTDPGNGITECHEMLTYVELDPREPDPLWFENESPAFTPTWV